MRKILPIIAVFGLLFALTGCDKILEGFYPEFANYAVGPSQQGVTVIVQLNNDVFNSPEFQNNNPIVVKFIPFLQSGTGSTDYYADVTNAVTQGYKKKDLPPAASQSNKWENKLEFGTPINAQWRTIAWLDKNNDGKVDPNEPVTLATDSSGGSVIDTTYGLRQAVTVTATLFSNSFIDQWILDQIQSGGQTGTNQPPIPMISEPYPREWSQSQSLNLDGNQSYDVDGRVVEWKWMVINRGPNGDLNPGDPANLIGTFSGAQLTITFPQVGFFDINLVVRDDRGAWSINKALATIKVSSTVIQQSKIHITGQNTADSNYVRFALVDRFTKSFIMQIDTWNTQFDNVFPNIPGGDYFIVAWVDANNNWLIDSGEPITWAHNDSDAYAFDVTLQVDIFKVKDGSNLEAKVDLAPDSTLPAGLLQVTSTEAAANTYYRIWVEVSEQDDPFGTGDPPSGAELNVRIKLLKPSGSQLPGTASYYQFTLDTNAYISVNDLTGNNLSYHPTPFNDYLYAVIDWDEDGTYGNGGDIEAKVPIKLMMGDGGVSHIIVAEYSWNIIPDN